jgi:hypothetical protein
VWNKNRHQENRNVTKIQQTTLETSHGPGTSSDCYRTETARTFDEDYGKQFKIYTDGLKMGDKVGYDIVKEEHTIKKRILPQNTVFSAEQSAIIGAIQSEKNSRHEIVIITDTLSTMMAANSRTSTKNSKTQTIRKMLDRKDQELPSHGSPVTRKYQVTKKPTRHWKKLDEDIPTLKDTHQTTWRNGWPKRISKKETKDGKTETTRWKKGSRTLTESRIHKECQRKSKCMEIFRLRTK